MAGKARAERREPGAVKGFTHGGRRGYSVWKTLLLVSCLAGLLWIDWNIIRAYMHYYSYFLAAVLIAALAFMVGQRTMIEMRRVRRIKFDRDGLLMESLTGRRKVRLDEPLHALMTMVVPFPQFTGTPDAAIRFGSGDGRASGDMLFFSSIATCNAVMEDLSLAFDEIEPGRDEARKLAAVQEENRALVRFYAEPVFFASILLTTGIMIAAFPSWDNTLLGPKTPVRMIPILVVNFIVFFGAYLAVVWSLETGIKGRRKALARQMNILEKGHA